MCPDWRLLLLGRSDQARTPSRCQTLPCEGSRLPEFAVLQFHRGQAADQVVVFPPEGFLFLSQHGQAPAQVQQFLIAFQATETRNTTRGHGDLQMLWSA